MVRLSAILILVCMTASCSPSGDSDVELSETIERWAPSECKGDEEPKVLPGGSADHCWILEDTGIVEAADSLRSELGDAGTGYRHVASECKGFDDELLAGLITDCLLVYDNGATGTQRAVFVSLDAESTEQAIHFAREVYENGALHKGELSARPVPTVVVRLLDVS